MEAKPFPSEDVAHDVCRSFEVETDVVLVASAFELETKPTIAAANLKNSCILGKLPSEVAKLLLAGSVKA